MLNNSENKIFQYNGSPISFQKGNSVMVNATQMAKPFGKRPAKWLELPSAKEFISVLIEVRKSDIALIQTVKGGTNGGGGTWMHEDVALDFAQWLSVDFRLWCNDRIKELLLNGSTSLPQHPHSGELGKALDRINSLTAELNYLRGRMDAEKELAEARVRLETQKKLMEVQQELMKTQRELSEARIWLRLADLERSRMINMKRSEGIILESKLRPGKGVEPQQSPEPLQAQKESRISLKECKSYIYTKKAVLRRYPGAMVMREICARIRKVHRISRIVFTKKRIYMRTKHITR